MSMLCSVQKGPSRKLKLSLIFLAELCSSRLGPGRKLGHFTWAELELKPRISAREPVRPIDTPRENRGKGRGIRGKKGKRKG